MLHLISKIRSRLSSFAFDLIASNTLINTRSGSPSSSSCADSTSTLEVVISPILGREKEGGRERIWRREEAWRRWSRASLWDDWNCQTLWSSLLFIEEIGDLES